MFYREGMPGAILFTGVAMIAYFVVGTRYEATMLWSLPTSLGTFLVMLMIQLFTIGMAHLGSKKRLPVRQMLLVTFVATTVALLVSKFIYAFDIIWVQLAVTIYIIATLLYQALRERMRKYLLFAVFSIGSLAFFYSSSYVLNNILQHHQRERINVLLGLKEDLSGAGYNVHQSQIAIGSGGLRGKGFLNGTQTKLKYVPEQDTDFIFCTVGEEEGFLGSAGVLLLFLALLLRLIHVAERQPFKFGRIYGYCVLSIFMFHLFINVGMVLGLTPVIGIPLPFFSYGGSSLWGFTILLFIFLRIDAGRNLVRQ
jgi:rod shape determining protein RodA